ncbi:MAG: carboxylating nicotinate-nucleotide diphosphorylase [Planctomycetota bacterium]
MSLDEANPPPPSLGPGVVDPLLRRALEEDVGKGDVTSDALIPAARRACGRLIAKEPGIACGLGVFARVFTLLDPGAAVHALVEDGAEVRPGERLVEVTGRARSLLAGERTALNLVQRMSGIATLTHAFVRAAGTGVRVFDTRKTTPGLRVLEKYAVRCGGAENHRFGLHDEAMIKNNHVDLAGSTLAALVGRLRQALGPDLVIHAEARDEVEAFAAVQGGADVVLLDNMSPAALRELCPRLRALAGPEGRPVAIEASGGVTLDRVAEIAASGVDRISVGALTHSAPSLDLSFRIEALP